jgi:2-oxoglutarate ferredoxin oxidoreductase subunit gamma
MTDLKTDIEVRFSGAGGQGLILSTRMLADALIGEGWSVAQSQSYEPTSRGGLSRADIVAAKGSTPDFPLATSLDLLLILDEVAAKASTGHIKSGAQVVVDPDMVKTLPEGDFNITKLRFNDKARGLGNARVANIIALGAMMTLSPICPWESLEAAVRQHAPKAFLELNLQALDAGRQMIEQQPV